MVPLAQLWLPALVSAVLIFAASSLIHMVLKWHNREYHAFTDEEGVRAVIRGNPPGQYALPFVGDMKRMKEPDMQRKFAEGPVAFVTVRPHGSFNMGAPLAMWFVYTLAVSAIAGCVTLGLPAATSVVAFLAYAGGSIQHGIWMGKPWSSVAKEVLDAAIYGAITGGVFAWLFR
jgi:hypothetical protein